MPESAPQPGWYPDPSGSGQRYWDGHKWGPAAPTEQLPAPAQKKRRWPFILGAIVVFLIILAAIGNSNSNDSGNSSSTTSGQPAAAPGAPPASAPTSSPNASPLAGIGQEVRDGKFAFTVTSVDQSKTAGNPDNQFEIVTAQGEFLNVHLTVSNIGDQPQTFFASNQKLNIGGNDFSANDMAAMWTQSLNVAINPGNSIQAVVSFDVPPNTADDGVLTVHDSAFSGGAKISLQSAGQ